MSSNEPSAVNPPAIASRPAESRTRLRAGVLLVVTFLAGAIVGMLGDRLVLLHQHRMLPRHGLRFVSARIVKALTRELHLTDDQQKQVAAILENHRKRVEAIWSEVHPRMRQEVEATDRDIERVLTPEQRPRFRELSNRWHAGAGRLVGGTH
ncbi:MAG TPA: hypothetical protein VHL58_05490 [Thermoanaerobaculia bacterium]|nr:hypothetical protein [Thermoanaerobaculia bacterium]